MRRQIEVNGDDGRVGRQVVGAFTHVDMHADQHDRLADRHRHGLRQPADAHLGALQIGQQRDRLLRNLGGLAYQPGHARVKRIVAVAEVHTRHAHARTNHFGQHLHVSACRPDGCDYVSHRLSRVERLEIRRLETGDWLRRERHAPISNL